MQPAELEKKTREVATLRWGVTAQPEYIDGIDFDCVLTLSDRLIIIENTCSHDVNKIRSDIATRLVPVRRNKFQEDIFVECYEVLDYQPTRSMIDYAKKAKVKIVSIDEFMRQFFDYRPYVEQRNDSIFGSAFDPNTGRADTKKYVKVSYKDSNGKAYSVPDIAQRLKQGDKIILLGNYGTGKSRCTKEVFNCLSNESNYYTFSINLRDCWGLRRQTEILNRHFEELGLSTLTDKVIRLSKQENAIFLLDGFDEIGSQTWSIEEGKIKRARKAALQGVREIVRNARGGVLVTGREQYFNDDREMNEALGISAADHALVLYCPEEFTEEEMREYLTETSPDLVGSIPDWIPKKPLTYNVLSDIPLDDINQLNGIADSHLRYWNLLINHICIREAKIRDITLEPDAILGILKELSHYIFLNTDEKAVITPEAMEKAYHQVLGYSPDSEAAIILQRLPGLARVSQVGPYRVFSDSFLLNCLKASYIIDEIERFGLSPSSDKWEELSVPNETWKTKLDELGFTLLQEHYELKCDTYERYVRRYLPMKNLTFSSILLTVIISSEHSIDFRNKTVSYVEFDSLSLTEECRNIVFSDCSFRELDISGYMSGDNGVFLRECLIEQVIGIGNISAVPTWIQDNCEIKSYQTSQRITDLRKRGNISTQQMVLLTILQRIFLQRGSGRVESALFRGLEDAEKEYVQNIIDLLVSHKFIKKVPSNGATLYIPVRDKFYRVNQIKNELTRSSDPLWLAVSAL